MTPSGVFALLIGMVIMLPLAILVDFILEPILGSLSFSLISYLLDAVMTFLYFLWSLFIEYYKAKKQGIKQSIIESAKKTLITVGGEIIPVLGDWMPFWTLRVVLEMLSVIKQK